VTPIPKTANVSPSTQRNLRRRPLPLKLIVGAILCSFLLFIAVIGPRLAPYPRDWSEKIAYEMTEEGPVAVYPPRPPSTAHWLGTDRWGYDIFSLILYGAPWTIFTALAVACARVFVGACLGLVRGTRAGEAPSLRNTGPLGALPHFLVVFFVMAGINTASPLHPWQLVLIQGLLMTAVGVPAIASSLSEKVYTHKRAQFVEAAESLGAGRVRVGIRHIVPMLREDLMLLVLTEVILVLTLLGQLGIFNLFLGGTKLGLDPPAYYSITNEWAGLIGQSRASLQVNQWTVLAPLGAFVSAVISLYVLLRGLEQWTREGLARHSYLSR